MREFFTKHLKISFFFVAMILLWLVVRSDSFPLLTKEFGGARGGMLSGIILSSFFLFIGYELQKDTELKIDKIHSGHEHGLSLKAYERMIEFLATGLDYNFKTNIKMSDGDYYTYALRGIPDAEGKPKAFRGTNFEKYIILVSNISFRDQKTDEEKREYIYGPLQIGEAYYLRFSQDKWYIDCGSRYVEIGWSSQSLGAWSEPTPSKIAFDNNPLKPSLKKLDSFYMALMEKKQILDVHVIYLWTTL